MNSDDLLIVKGTDEAVETFLVDNCDCIILNNCIVVAGDNIKLLDDNKIEYTVMTV